VRSPTRPVPRRRLVAGTLLALLALAAASLGQDAARVTPQVVATQLENDHVRVLDFHSHPGDREGWHSHPAMVVYVLSGGTLRISTPGGTPRDVVFKTGETIFREPTTHATENVGTTTLHALLVELKGS